MTRLSVVMLGLILVLGTAQATPTDITIRVLAKDAKFIGSGMDGARVVLQDANTGELLAEGIFVDRSDIRAHGQDERLAVESFYDSRGGTLDERVSPEMGEAAGAAAAESVRRHRASRRVSHCRRRVAGAFAAHR